MKLKASDIPKDFPVKPISDEAEAKDRSTCGACGLSWDDGVITHMTPAPAARCPFEAFHVYPDDPQRMGDVDLLMAIQELLDGVEWDSDTLEDIATLLNDNGYQVRDPNDLEDEDDDEET
jgi:hypothetical protein